MTKVIEACGADVTAENLMTQARSLHDVALPGLIPGSRSARRPTTIAKELRPQRVDGTRWVPIADKISVR